MWLYHGKELADNEIPVKAVGFIYLMTQISTGKKYIGRKLLTKSSSKTIAGKKKKTRSSSDWKDYWSSSSDVKELISVCGKDDFIREILSFITSRGMMAYAEEMCLYLVGALEHPDMWLNRNIRAKIYLNWVKPNEAAELRTAIRHHIE